MRTNLVLEALVPAASCTDLAAQPLNTQVQISTQSFKISTQTSTQSFKAPFSYPKNLGFFIKLDWLVSTRFNY